MSEIKSIFLLEENITRAYAIAQSQVNSFIRSESKYTIKEIAEKLGMDRGTLSKKLKDQKFEAKEFYDLLNLINQELCVNLGKKIKELETKK